MTAKTTNFVRHEHTENLAGERLSTLELGHGGEGVVTNHELGGEVARGATYEEGYALMMKLAEENPAPRTIEDYLS